MPPPTGVLVCWLVCFVALTPQPSLAAPSGDTCHPSLPPPLFATPEGETSWVTPPPLGSRSLGHSVLPKASGTSLLAFPVVQLQSAVGTRRGLYLGLVFYLILESCFKCFKCMFQINLRVFIHVWGSTTYACGTKFEKAVGGSLPSSLPAPLPRGNHPD